jgi:ankyrin repeat protein
VRLLVSAGVSIDSVDNHSMSALHYAAQGTCLPSMQLLLSNNASVNAVSSLNETPLSLAAHACSSNTDAIEAISMLLMAGASLACLHKMFPKLCSAAKALLQKHVRRTSLATAASIRAISAQKQESSGGASQALCSDTVHIILAKSLDLEEEFLRLLLNGRGEECAVQK